MSALGVPDLLSEMAEAPKGIKNNSIMDCCFIEKEAECVDESNTLDDLFEGSTDGSDISNLIDDSAVDQGNSCLLYTSDAADE